MTLPHAPVSADVYPHQAVRGSGFATSGLWFGSVERPLAGWWTAPERPSRDGVVIAQPLGYEYWSCHRSLRALAEALAGSGWHALRFDYDGTGDSAGAADDPERVAAWRASLRQAVQAMRDAGMQRIALVGVRLGATLALLDAAALGIDAVVACAPVVSGKRWLKELRMLGTSDPAEPETLTYSGLVIDPATAAGLAGIDLVKNPPCLVPRTLLVTRPEPTNARLIDALHAGRHRIDVHECANMRSMLDVPSEDATLPSDFVQPIVAWLGEAKAAVDAGVPAMHGEAEMPWQRASLRATFMRVAGLAAIGETPATSYPDTVVVFLNSGSEPHIGPGRAWTEYARALALHGYACLRADFRGWGGKPRRGSRPRATLRCALCRRHVEDRRRCAQPLRAHRTCGALCRRMGCAECRAANTRGRCVRPESAVVLAPR